MRYAIADPNEFLVITGACIKTVKITKSAWVWPLQKFQRFSVQPNDYELFLQYTTQEKYQISFPVVFTVGPDVRTPQAAEDDVAGPENDKVSPLAKYAILLAHKPNANGSQVQHLIRGIIEGETRALVLTMTLEEILTQQVTFKKTVSDNIQAKLNQFGLRVYNGEVKDLR
jgi:flotillin